MLAVGLTGGIGSGKSTVAAMLVARGAVLVDADQVAREVVAPGGSAYQPLVDRFGEGIVAGDGTIDRPGLAALTFPDPQALADLNAITHPAVGVEMLARRNAEAGTDHVVVFDIPLLQAGHRQVLSLGVVVVVDCPPELALRRLVDVRGMDEADARARMAAQVDRVSRLALADVVVPNEGDLQELDVAVGTLWEDLARRATA